MMVSIVRGLRNKVIITKVTISKIWKIIYKNTWMTKYIRPLNPKYTAKWKMTKEMKLFKIQMIILLVVEMINNYNSSINSNSKANSIAIIVSFCFKN